MPKIKMNPILRKTGYAFFFALACAAAFFSYPYWSDSFENAAAEVEHEEHSQPPVEENTAVRISEQASLNLGLFVKPCVLQTYWRKIQTTGVIVDRPGYTDRGITSPIDCIIASVHAYEGDIVRPGEKLFTLRLASEHLHRTQSDFFKAVSEIKILNREIKRIGTLASSGVIPEKRIIALKQDISRQFVLVEAFKQELITRGLNEDHLQQIRSGKFVKTIDVVAPGVNSPVTNNHQVSKTGFTSENLLEKDTFLELQELKVELGQQVQSGELLAMLANHNDLYINGHAFKKEASNIARAAELGWKVEVEFLEDTSTDWQTLNQPFNIRHLANTIDIGSRTFDFFIPLTNQFRKYSKENRTFVIWRFRPGQRVRIHVPVKEMKDVIVVPSDAVIADGPDTFVFQQNGDLYNRIAVHVLFRDRLNTVIANDGSLLPGFYVAQNSAASLNRVLKVQTASGSGAGNFHIHADGTVHSNH